jgi:hypothetical protein
VAAGIAGMVAAARGTLLRNSALFNALAQTAVGLVGLWLLLAMLYGWEATT